MSIYNIIYQITNLINNKIYIGKHITSDLDDDYLGSGKLLLHSIKKYGKDNFKKEILFIFNSEEEMNLKESELVDLKFVQRDDTYNISLGGNGGITVLVEGHPKYEETKNKISESRKGSRHWTNGVDTVMSKNCPGENWIIGRGPTYNKRSSDSLREKMSSNRKNNYFWWNNGTENKRSKDCPGVEWKRGRLMSSSLYSKFCKKISDS